MQNSLRTRDSLARGWDHANLALGPSTGTLAEVEVVGFVKGKVPDQGGVGENQLLAVRVSLDQRALIRTKVVMPAVSPHGDGVQLLNHGRISAEQQRCVLGLAIPRIDQRRSAPQFRRRQDDDRPGPLGQVAPVNWRGDLAGFVGPRTGLEVLFRP